MLVNCVIPLLIQIVATDPCWTIDRVRTAYVEAQADIQFARWLLDRPYSNVPFEQVSLRLVEFADRPALGRRGQFTPALFTQSVDNIDYSKADEVSGPLQVLRHEMGHLVELQQEYLAEDWSNDWMFVGHGGLTDLFVRATNRVAAWFYRGMSPAYDYWPGFIGRP